MIWDIVLGSLMVIAIACPVIESVLAWRRRQDEEARWARILDKSMRDHRACENRADDLRAHVRLLEAELRELDAYKALCDQDSADAVRIAAENETLRERVRVLEESKQ